MEEEFIYNEVLTNQFINDDNNENQLFTHCIYSNLIHLLPIYLANFFNF